MNKGWIKNGGRLDGGRTEKGWTVDSIEDVWMGVGWKMDGGWTEDKSKMYGGWKKGEQRLDGG